MKQLGDLAGLLTLLLVLGALLGALSCLALFGWSAWPTRAERIQRVLEAAPTRCLYVGLCNVGVYLIVILLVARHAGGRLLAVLLLAWLIVHLVSGLPALAMLVGERVRDMADAPWSRLRCTLVGMAVVAGACVLPIVGQVTGVLVLAATFGGALSAFLARRSG